MKTVEAARKALERALEDKDKRVRLTARLTLEGKSLTLGPRAPGTPPSPPEA